MTTATSIDSALLDVRKAYRLLADYQQRILELLGFIREELGADYYYQVPRNRVPRSLEGLEVSNSAGQRFLPFNDISVLWLRNAGQEDPVHCHEKGDLLFDVWVRSDTGNGADDEEASIVEHSRSELRIYIFQCVEPHKGPYNWFSQVWQQTRYPAMGELLECDDNPGYRAYAEALDLSVCTDEDAIRTAFNELRKRASEKLDQQI
ncbi:hypothetical protein [Pseudomonas mosselii]|uniref:hypothetical protein n=1 Tax=Pseudomonas TaxID=286 RepID=UPI0024479AFF|nr:hypothetical protein [Pseudomonas mosselii]MDH1528002.1 hypothetical protein [Pseudomonas mosselii]